MPEIELKSVTEVSGEDTNNHLIANNLLLKNDYKSWKCAKWETSSYVIFELTTPSSIDSIEIGNDCSAFVEVLVRRSDEPKQRFQVLLSTSSFMTPSESNSVINTNRVRVFNKQKLSPNSVNENWDFVKVVCTQPFNKNLCYGLAFIKLNSKSTNDEMDESLPAQTSHKIGPFKINSDDSSQNETLSAGALFAKRTALPANTDQPVSPKPLSLAAAVGITPSKVNMRAKKDLNGAQASPSSPLPAIVNKNNQNSNKVQGSPKPSTSTSTSHTKKLTKPVEPPVKRKRKPKIVPFSQVMAKVIFTLSGYVNPKRSQLRAKAMEMGAKFRPNWDTSCTHLVCAFDNTPKFKEVSAKKGRIVSEKWIDDCYAQKKLIPWRTYMMGRYNGPDSDPESETDDTPNNVQYFDSEDEESLPALRNATHPNSKNLDASKDDAIYDAETDDE